MPEKNDDICSAQSETRVIRPEKDSDYEWPAALLAGGGLVAFPTETVYGLGADATNPRAVADIFRAKGRPSDNPLIVHVSDKSEVQALVREITPLAKCLMDAFMPGPITLIMKKSGRIPDIVSAGLDTVGIRLPSHPVAQKLIRMSGVPVAAPSANLSGSPSPTHAEHVYHDLRGRIPCIIDGGPCDVGLESSVVDATGSWPVILRPGAVTMEMLADACRKAGILSPDEQILTHDHAEKGEAPRAPGMKYRHYAPKAPLSIVMPGEDGSREKLLFEGVAEALCARESGTVGIFCGKAESEYLKRMLKKEHAARTDFYVYGNDGDIRRAARCLFDGIRSLDRQGVIRIFASGFEGKGLEKAYMNRLGKAAGERKELDPEMAIKTPEKKNVLFVCTGNTCRSPMAAAIFNDFVQKRGHYVLKGDALSPADLSGSSAGIYAADGYPAAPQAIQALRRLYDIDLEGHLSRKVTEEILARQDLVFAVTREHAAMLREIFPAFAGKIHSFAGYINEKRIPFGGSGGMGAAQTADIPDPFGQSEAVYERIASHLSGVISEMWPAVLADLGIEEG